MPLNLPLQDVILVWFTPFNSSLSELNYSSLHQSENATTPLFFKKNPPYRNSFFSDTSIIKQIGMSICVCIMGDLFIKN